MRFVLRKIYFLGKVPWSALPGLNAKLWSWPAFVCSSALRAWCERNGKSYRQILCLFKGFSSWTFPQKIRKSMFSGLSIGKEKQLINKIKWKIRNTIIIKYKSAAIFRFALKQKITVKSTQNEAMVVFLGTFKQGNVFPGTPGSFFVAQQFL